MRVASKNIHTYIFLLEWKVGWQSRETAFFNLHEKCLTGRPTERPPTFRRGALFYYYSPFDAWCLVAHYFSVSVQKNREEHQFTVCILGLQKKSTRIYSGFSLVMEICEKSVASVLGNFPTFKYNITIQNYWLLETFQAMNNHCLKCHLAVNFGFLWFLKSQKTHCFSHSCFSSFFFPDRKDGGWRCCCCCVGVP